MLFLNMVCLTVGVAFKAKGAIEAVSALILIFTLVDLVLCIWSIVIMDIAIHRSKINCSHYCYDSDDSAYG
jgi:uncharacterized Tic20 family protein